MYRKPAYLRVGSAADCDIVLQGPGVAESHAQIEWNDGFVVRDLGTGETRVNGVKVEAKRARKLSGYGDVVELGGATLDLYEPKLTLLFVQPLQGSIGARPFVLGSDRRAADVLVDHSSVAGAHARVNVEACTVTDLGSENGTLMTARNQRSGGDRRLAPNEPELLGDWTGALLGDVWVPRLALEGRLWAREANRPSTVVAELAVGSFTIGRSERCEIRLSLPQVSAEHAQVTRRPDGQLSIKDLGSTNGTTVRGTRLRPGESAFFDPNERVLIGPYPLRIDARKSRIELDGEVEIVARDLTYDVRDRDGEGTVRLLDRVSFKALPGDCIALMGPSGAGKTTLLSVLSGAIQCEGEVLINGQNLKTAFEALRGCIGFVPQDDIVHPELTIEEAVRFSARMRLPADFTDAELEERVERTLKDLRLYEIRRREIGKPEKKILSGGERKRVNIALELVTDPTVLFLDEPTSGLAADDTTALVTLLTGLARERGKTIIATIHQPAKSEYEMFNFALVLGFGGIMAYFGPTREHSYAFFGACAEELGHAGPVDGPREIFEMIALRERSLLKEGKPNNQARREASMAWRASYFREADPTKPPAVAPSPFYELGYGGPRTLGQSAPGGLPAKRRVRAGRHFLLLLRRYALVKVRDRAALAVLLLQAPVIGLLITAVFWHTPPAPDPGASATDTREVRNARGEDPLPCQAVLTSMEDAAEAAQSSAPAGEPPKSGAKVVTKFELEMCAGSRTTALAPIKVNDQTRAIYFLVITALWFGTSNAAREIVSEQAIYRRERMVNLSILNYIASKMVVLAGICLFQCAALLGLAYSGLGLSGRFGVLLGFLFVASLCASALGLLLSTVVRSPEAAVALTPLLLIPQVVLGGGVVELSRSRLIAWLSRPMPSRWAFEGALGEERSHVQWDAVRGIRYCIGGEVDGKAFEVQDKFNCAVEHMTNAHPGWGGLGLATAAQPWVAASVLLAITVLSLALVAGLLKRRDSV